MSLPWWTSCPHQQLLCQRATYGNVWDGESFSLANLVIITTSPSLANNVGELCSWVVAPDQKKSVSCVPNKKHKIFDLAHKSWCLLIKFVGLKRPSNSSWFSLAHVTCGMRVRVRAGKELSVAEPFLTYFKQVADDFPTVLTEKRRKQKCCASTLCHMTAPKGRRAGEKHSSCSSPGTT